MAPQSTNQVIDYLTFTENMATKLRAENGSVNNVNAPNLCIEPLWSDCTFQRTLDLKLLTVCIWLVCKAVSLISQSASVFPISVHYIALTESSS